ncbi:hypothetical protein BRADO4099 [Bradyrhizobium sp. ORS 278]|nr:hypothetical protein BRADO4099 [Bradyrhizobium sp. ORS 278]
MSNKKATTKSDVVSWRWYQRLVHFCYGIGMGGFLFCFVLAFELTRYHRPTFPEPEFGFTHLIHVDHSRDTVYVTYVEYLTHVYGPWATWGVVVVSGLCGFLLGMRNKTLDLSGHIQVGCACAASLILIYLAWYYSVEQILLGLRPAPH